MLQRRKIFHKKKENGKSQTWYSFSEKMRQACGLTARSHSLLKTKPGQLNAIHFVHDAHYYVPVDRC